MSARLFTDFPKGNKTFFAFLPSRARKEYDKKIGSKQQKAELSSIMFTHRPLSSSFLWFIFRIL